jgi:hypothetical protein
MVLRNAATVVGGPGPIPRRAGPTWAEYLPCQAKAILATDSFTVTLLNGATGYSLAIIEHASQRVRILWRHSPPKQAVGDPDRSDPDHGSR